MYRLLLVKITLILFCSSAYSSDVEKYAEALGWHEKWQKVVTRQTDNYVNKYFLGKLSELPEATKQKVARKLQEGMSQHIAQQGFGDVFMESVVSECGTDLLNKFVDFYSGVDFSADEKQEMSSAYRNCGKSAIAKLMGVIYASFDRLPYNSEKSENSFNKTVGRTIIIRQKAFKSFRDKYLDAKGHKAFAQSASGNWNWRSNRTSADHAVNNALATCRAHNMQHEKTQPCKVINVDDKWTDIYTQSITQGRKNESLLMSNKALSSYKQKYLDVSRDKAFAQSTNGSWSWRSSNTSKEDAIKKALRACQKNNKNHEDVYPCQIVNVNNEWLNE